MGVIELFAVSFTAVLATHGMRVAAELMGEEQALRDLEATADEAR